MIKLSFKIDVNIVKLALVFAGSAACYGFSQFVSGLSSSAPQGFVSDKFCKKTTFDVDNCKKNSNGLAAVKKNKIIFGVSGNHSVNNKVVRKVSETISVRTNIKVNKNLFLKHKSRNSGANTNILNQKDYVNNQRKLTQRIKENKVFQKISVFKAKLLNKLLNLRRKRTEMIIVQ